MKSIRWYALACAGALALVAAAACGEDEATVRPRLPGADTDAGTVPEGGALSCGVTIPSTYESAAFDTNVAVERDLAARFKALEEKMAATEGASTATVTAAELKALYGEGAPSLRAISTTPAQAVVEGYFDAYGEAVGKTWTPADVEQDGGALAGGKYDALFYLSKTGVDLRAAGQKTLLGGALYNHVVGLAAGTVTEAVVDRFLAAFGASRALANRTDADAGSDTDTLIAEFASRRDDKSSATPGPYRKIKTALLTMKAAAAGGEKCKPDLDAAVATFLLEWERATYASAIFYLNDAAVSALDPGKGPQALHSYGQALGFIQSFKGASKRKITDDQIDALILKIGAATPHKLVTSVGVRTAELKDAIVDIQAYEEFLANEVESFKKDF